MPGSDYLDKCVGKVISAALVHPPDMPAEAFDYALEARWSEPEKAHIPYLLVDYDQFGVTFGDASVSAK